jgi:hypothetical protein
VEQGWSRQQRQVEQGWSRQQRQVEQGWSRQQRQVGQGWSRQQRQVEQGWSRQQHRATKRCHLQSPAGSSTLLPIQTSAGSSSTTSLLPGLSCWQNLVWCG